MVPPAQTGGLPDGPGRSTMREALTVHAVVVVAYLTGIVPAAGREPSMLTFGQPSSVHEVAPVLRNTIAATVPGIVTAGDCGPRIRRSCPEQRASA